jgi:predicted RNase H-like HicB family nuclease
MTRTRSLEVLNQLKDVIEKLKADEVDDPEEILQDINAGASIYVEALEFAIRDVGEI